MRVYEALHTDDVKGRPPNFMLEGKKDAIYGCTAFGRDNDMQKDLIRFFKKAVNERRIPKDGFHVFFPSASIGCEPYNFAILARQAGLLKDNILKIVASDLQPEFVEYATEGIYPKSVVDYSPDDISGYFKPVARSNKVVLSPEIKRAVQFEPAGDIRTRVDNERFDAVVVTNAIYHYYFSANRKSLLTAALNLSRGFVVTDYTSFDENRRLFEEMMMKTGYGILDDDQRPSALKPFREATLRDKILPYGLLKPHTNIEGFLDKGYFLAVRL